MPRPAATLLVVRPAVDGLEVLMLERPARGFFGGLWVFPGGAVDPVDAEPPATAAVTVPDGTDDAPWRAAALRETVEEVGLAITSPPWDGPLVASGVEVYRAVRAAGATLAGERLRLLSQWVTPAGAPTRFDARFYLVIIEGDPLLAPRTGEVIGVAWTTPGAALERGSAGDWSLITPTVRHLEWLARQQDVDHAWEAASTASIDRSASLQEADGSEVLVSLPGTVELP